MLNDILIAIAYFTIPTVIGYWLYKRGRRTAREYQFTLILFAVFIFSCGITHCIKAVFFYHPWYYAQAVVGLITALISLATAVYLFTIVPGLLELPEQVRNLEEGIQQRTQTVLSMQHNIDSLQVLRDINQDMRSVGMQYKDVVASFCNAVIRRARARSVVVFKNEKMVYASPPWNWIKQIQPSAQATRLYQTLRTASMSSLPKEVIASLFELEPDRVEGSWRTGTRTVDCVGHDQHDEGWPRVWTTARPAKGDAGLR
jgi:hypothetical protein